ncbi:hypothetical protein AWB82_06686 [Caballeronia glebae]|uniref:Uncharacterized protein n=1 Tax=Caballeronia glebae TaxID=1777143 RepID=A0A158DF27_9BURK|nr:hypothetical protein AWB82_06686 [Caballeronia glebae]
MALAPHLERLKAVGENVQAVVDFHWKLTDDFHLKLTQP